MCSKSRNRRFNFHLFLESLTIININFLNPDIITAISQKESAKILPLLLLNQDNIVMRIILDSGCCIVEDLLKYGLYFRFSFNHPIYLFLLIIIKVEAHHNGIERSRYHQVLHT